MDSSDLAATFQEYFRAGLAQSTQRTYEVAMRHYTQFCMIYTIQPTFPVYERLLCYFATYLAKRNLAPQTIKSYLAAVRNAQIAIGLPDRDQSSMPLLTTRGEWQGLAQAAGEGVVSCVTGMLTLT